MPKITCADCKAEFEWPHRRKLRCENCHLSNRRSIVQRSRSSQVIAGSTKEESRSYELVCEMCKVQFSHADPRKKRCQSCQSDFHKTICKNYRHRKSTMKNPETCLKKALYILRNEAPCDLLEYAKTLERSDLMDIMPILIRRAVLDVADSKGHVLLLLELFANSSRCEEVASSQRIQCICPDKDEAVNRLEFLLRLASVCLETSTERKFRMILDGLQLDSHMAKILEGETQFRFDTTVMTFLRSCFSQ